MRHLLIKHETYSCKMIYEKPCGFDHTDECDNCAAIYEGESDYIMDELNRCGYDVEDICEHTYRHDNYEHYRIWWVKVDGHKEKEPDLTILKPTDSLI